MKVLVNHKYSWNVRKCIKAMYNKYSIKSAHKFVKSLINVPLKLYTTVQIDVRLYFINYIQINFIFNT